MFVSSLALPLAGGFGWVVSASRNSTAEQHQKRNMIKSRKSAAADFFLHFAHRANLNSAQPILTCAQRNLNSAQQIIIFPNVT